MQNRRMALMLAIQMRRGFEMIFVSAMFFGFFCILEVVVNVKTLTFAVRRYGYFVPVAVFVNSIDVKFPVNSTIFILAAQIYDLGVLGAQARETIRKEK
jgi:hypothetical protein